MDKIKDALKWIGIDAMPADCDVCTDGSVYWGLVMILPKGSVYPGDVEVWDAV
jgi:hypothetical protein